MDIVIYDLPLVVGLISLTVVIVKVLAYKASKQGEWTPKVGGESPPPNNPNKQQTKEKRNGQRNGKDERDTNGGSRSR